MHIARKIALYCIITISTLVVLASVLSLIYDLAFWYTKVLDFPRLQYLLLAVLCLLLFLLLNKTYNIGAIALSVGLVAAIAIQCMYIFPYVLGEKKVRDAVASSVNENSRVSIIIANVLIDNRDADGLLAIVREHKPDMLLVMEVNDWWIENLKALDSTFAHRVKIPADNAYGMALYSRLPLGEIEKTYLNHDDVPSIHARVALPSGQSFMFHGVHPVAPVPSTQYPDNVGRREVALIKVGRMVRQHGRPAIVAGDFNDVSWSRTSRLFEIDGGLNNVRLGRGLYNSFDATSPIMRWPLDHFFVSDAFGLIDLKRLPSFGSDHFPMYAQLVLE
jgi:endonuclease/exonuclease/phosphatase (EEP) superfamily protein YafD